MAAMQPDDAFPGCALPLAVALTLPLWAIAIPWAHGVERAPDPPSAFATGMLWLFAVAALVSLLIIVWFVAWAVHWPMRRIAVVVEVVALVVFLVAWVG